MVISTSKLSVPLYWHDCSLVTVMSCCILKGWLHALLATLECWYQPISVLTNLMDYDNCDMWICVRLRLSITYILVLSTSIYIQLHFSAVTYAIPFKLPQLGTVAHQCLWLLYSETIPENLHDYCYCNIFMTLDIVWVFWLRYATIARQSVLWEITEWVSCVFFLIHKYHTAQFEM